MVKRMNDPSGSMKKSPEIRDGVRKKYTIEKDPSTMDAEELIKAVRRFLSEEDPEELTPLSAKTDGDRATLRVKEKKTKSGTEPEKDRQLEKEDGTRKRVME